MGDELSESATLGGEEPKVDKAAAVANGSAPVATAFATEPALDTAATHSNDDGKRDGPHTDHSASPTEEIIDISGMADNDNDHIGPNTSPTTVSPADRKNTIGANGTDEAATDGAPKKSTTGNGTAPEATTNHTPRRNPSQPRFATLNLPVEYDRFPLLMRLWLQARMIGKDDTRASSKTNSNAKEDEKPAANDKAPNEKQKPNGDKSKAANGAPTPAAALRFGSNSPRQVTFANMLVALDLCLLMAPRLWELMSFTVVLRLGVYVACLVLKGIMPALELWAGSQLMDLVERSLRDGAVPWSEVSWVVGRTVFLSVLQMAVKQVSTRNAYKLRIHLNHYVDQVCLQTHLALGITESSSPMWTALVGDLSRFAGQATHDGDGWTSEKSNRNPFESMKRTGDMLCDTISLISQFWVLVHTLSASGSGRLWTLDNALLVGATALPAGVMWITSRMKHTLKDQYYYEAIARYTASQMCRIGTAESHKQEVLLFGLAPWVMRKWEGAMNDYRKAVDEGRAEEDVYFAIQMTERVAENALFILIATQTINVQLSIGTLHLYQLMSSRVVSTYRDVFEASGKVYQAIFLAAAVFIALQPPPRGTLVNYKTQRRAGMHIEARGVAFTYPDHGSNSVPVALPASDSTAGRPEVLHNINITVLPGETLALVGFNGGGKTTLVKLLMGLLSGYTGSLTINGIEVSQYEKDTLHAYTSCVFQDFARYPVTLRENVSIGDITLVHDKLAIDRAINRGGAGEVASKAGDWVLDWYGNKDSSSPYTTRMPTESKKNEEEKSEKSDETSEKKKDDADGKDTVDTKSSKVQPESTTAKPKKKPKKKITDFPVHLELSGGQWQRVALARAFMRSDKADLIVFDEPSASLDPRAEAELFDRIHSLSGTIKARGRKNHSETANGGEEELAATGPTTIYISHRLSTVRRADKIALMEKGTITEFGTHAELMALGGRYHELFTLQRDGFVEDE